MPADDLLNYKGRIGRRSLQYSTIWIRDAGGEVIGSFGINIDYSSLRQAKELLEILSASTQTAVVRDLEDELPADLDDLIRMNVRRIRARLDSEELEPESYEDKMRIVQDLDKERLFLLRGAVNKVADILDISWATVYDYRCQED